jgi:hypothetical protein
MRPLLVNGGIIILIIVAMGSGLMLAAASSEPGMFLYPIKQTTRKFTGAGGDTLIVQPSIINVPQDGAGQKPSAAGGSTDPENIHEDVALGLDITEIPDPDQAANTPVPTPVRATDQITVSVEPSEIQNADLAIAGNVDSPPVINQLSSGHDGDYDNSNASDSGRNNEGPSDAHSNDTDHDNSGGRDNNDSGDDSKADD